MANQKKEDELILKKLQNIKIGLSITELVKKTNFSRSRIRTILAKLEGANKITYKKVGMAKIYHIKSISRR